jgi:transketolase
VAENHKTSGGLTSLVVETLYEEGIVRPIVRIGLEDSFFECGSQEYLEAKYGVDLPRFMTAILEGR